MALYEPDEVLPSYPTYQTVIKDGVRYKAFYETNWNQVMTDDGTPLAEVIHNLPDLAKDKFYRYRGRLHNKPGTSAMDQLYSIYTPEYGDVYLVEMTTQYYEDRSTYEAYVWLGEWVFSGSTSMKSTINKELPECIRLFPPELGEADQSLLISKDGKYITWGDPTGPHNENPDAHRDIRNLIEKKADKLDIFNDILYKDHWIHNPDANRYEYNYTNDNLPKGSYFELIPMIDENNLEVRTALANADICNTYKIRNGFENAYTTLTANHCPTLDIEICVKVYKSFTES